MIENLNELDKKRMYTEKCMFTGNVCSHAECMGWSDRGCLWRLWLNDNI